MKTARTIEEVRSAVRNARDQGERIGLVPTMGFLHAGHLSLIDVARRNRATFVVVSIFVNPIQFGPHEDFDSYPRDPNRDQRLLEDKEVDLLYLPDTPTMYPEGATTRIVVGPIAQPLEGERRPGHFEGVATVVLKLFNMIEPDLAVFGQKDAQQFAVVRRLVIDLNVPVELYVGETIREKDGLAMSSRNFRLSAEQRKLAPTLHQALLSGRQALTSGRKRDEVERIMRETLARTPGMEPDYLRLVDPETFQPPADLDRDLLLVGAARLGQIRLIDNIPIPRGSFK